MAKVYGGVEGLELPEFKAGDYDAYEKLCVQYEADIVKWCKENSNCPDAGEVIGFTVGDGKAMYAILDYRTLIHIGTHDGYALSDAHERGLRKADLVKEVKAVKAWKEMMKKNPMPKKKRQSGY